VQGVALEPTQQLRRFAKVVLGLNSEFWGEHVTLPTGLREELAQAMIKTGDILAQRLKLHAADSGRMDEQIDRYTGFNKSAKHLTWSYASFITMAEARKKAVRVR
jgi:GH15 family glucan-1,4-alpha-glucosidase